MENIMIHDHGSPIYPIVFADDFTGLGAAAISLPDMDGRKICIVSGSHVAPLYLDAVKESFCKYFTHVETFVFQAGERYKTLETVQNLYEHLIKKGFERGDVLAALGGGVAGDLTGYAAATYLRGIRFIQIPTSLLSQVDSSIGGKTGVDFRSYKNMVGAFHHPVMVYSNASALRTLPHTEYQSGMGEIIKHALIRDPGYYSWLKEHACELARPCFDEPETIRLITEMIYRSDRIKQAVVENDPTEKGERAILNFGHTLGHAVEKLADFSLPHGMCVSIGMHACAWISLQRGLLCNEAFEDLYATITDLYGLPVSAPSLSAEEILRTSKSDKKMDKGMIKMILLDGIGHAIICHDVSDAEILQAAKEITK